MRPRRSVLPHRNSALPLSSFFSSSSTLFVCNGASQRLSYQSVAHSFPLNGGRGAQHSNPQTCQRVTFKRSYVCQCPLLAFCFQQLPTIKFSTPFVLISMKIAGGVGGARPPWE